MQGGDYWLDSNLFTCSQTDATRRKNETLSHSSFLQRLHPGGRDSEPSKGSGLQCRGSKTHRHRQGGGISARARPHGPVRSSLRTRVVGEIPWRGSAGQGPRAGQYSAFISQSSTALGVVLSARKGI